MVRESRRVHEFVTSRTQKSDGGRGVGDPWLRLSGGRRRSAVQAPGQDRRPPDISWNQRQRRRRAKHNTRQSVIPSCPRLSSPTTGQTRRPRPTARISCRFALIRTLPSARRHAGDVRRQDPLRAEVLQGSLVRGTFRLFLPATSRLGVSMNNLSLGSSRSWLGENEGRIRQV